MKARVFLKYFVHGYSKLWFTHSKERNVNDFFYMFPVLGILTIQDTDKILI